MKSLCFILILLFPFAFWGCTVVDADVEESPPGPNFLVPNSHYVVCSGIVTEKATNTPIQGMRLRITKRTGEGMYGGKIDSVCETTSNEFGEYQMKFWYDANSREYLLQTICDSILLPNPHYHNVTNPENWYFIEGKVYKTDIYYKLDNGIKDAKAVTFSPTIEGYAYVTLRLKQSGGIDEPMTCEVVVNDTIKYRMLPILNASAFGSTFVFMGNAPQKVDIHIYRTIQSNKHLTKKITPLPTKLIVEEFEF